MAARKHGKKLRGAACAVLAGALSASLCCGGVAAAGTVNVAQLPSETAAGQVTYNAYKIFDATKNADPAGSASDITWANSDVKAKVEAVIKAEDPSYAGTTAQAAAEWIAKKVTGTTATTVVEATSIANKIAKAVAGTTATATVPSGTDTTLAQGYWLVTTAASSTSGKVDTTGTAPVFTLVGGDSDTVSITPKTSAPTVDKKVRSDADGSYQDAADSQVGQTVDYRLTGTVASNVAAYDTYKYAFTDTLSEGLTLVNAEGTEGATDGVVVKVDGTDVTARAVVAWNDNKLTVTFSDLKDVTPAGASAPLAITADTKVTVEYSAKLNDKAKAGAEGNSNSAALTYSNNPNTDSEGTSTPDVVKGYTYKLHLVKSDKATNVKLDGAVFTIQATTPDDTASTGKYVQSDGSLGDDPCSFTTAGGGVIDVKGLDAGTYTVHEVTAPPTGDANMTYKTVADFTFTVSPTVDAATGALTALGNTVSGTDVIAGLDTTDDNTLNADSGTAAVLADGVVNVTVADTETIKMPLTGEQGMALAAAAGLVIVTASAVSLVRRRRREQK